MKNKHYIKAINKTIKELKKLSLEKIDDDKKLLKKAFNIAYKNGLFTLYKYEKEFQEELKFLLFSKLTKYSSALTFLGLQILAANAIMNKNNFKRKELYFKKKCGIAINHLRSPKTYVKAKKCKDGYKLNGELTWASGYKIFNKLLIGFHFNNQEIEVLADLKKTKGFKISESPKVFVGQSLNTVNIKLDNFFVEERNIVSSNPIGNYTRNKSLSKTVHFAIYGLALGVLDYIKDKNFKKDLKKDLTKLKYEILLCKDGDLLDKLRVELFNLTQKAITLGMIQKGGKAILKDKTLQRYYRELIMFNANGLNQKMKDLFLEDFYKSK